VFATGRTLEKVADLKELGVECVALAVDDPKSVVACHTTVTGLLGGKGLDYLFNNAGMGMYGTPSSAF
jgi:1-acylglycerone phosphate reductase